MSGSFFKFDVPRGKEAALLDVFKTGNFREVSVPYALAAVETPTCRVTLYAKERHGCRTLTVQGRGADEFVTFTLEPNGLVPLRAATESAAEEEKAVAPHGGSDESGKGDYFGPLVVACAFVDERIAREIRSFRYLGKDNRTYPLPIMDCKAYADSASLTANEKILLADARLRAVLKPTEFVIVRRNPASYNRKYSRLANVNDLLAKAHGEAIERFLDQNPRVGRVVVDQFARGTWTLRRALGEFGSRVEIDQHHKAESDPAVAIASILARAEFIRAMDEMSKEVFGVDADGKPLGKVPFGSSDPFVAALAAACVRKHGPTWLMNHCKAHFKTTDAVLSACGLTRAALPEEGQTRKTT